MSDTDPVVAELRALMTKHGLTRQEAGRRMAASKTAVDSWLAPPTAKLHRKIKPYRLDLLRRSLEQDPPAKTEEDKKQ